MPPCPGCPLLAWCGVRLAHARVRPNLGCLAGRGQVGTESEVVEIVVGDVVAAEAEDGSVGRSA
jgi:hypothetical protein